jgi:hypothetical protein
VLASIGLAALLVTITQARRWGVPSAATLTGVVIASEEGNALWARSALRRPEPRMMRRRPIWTTNVAAFLVGVGQFAGFVLIPQYVQSPRAPAPASAPARSPPACTCCR